MKKKRIQKIAIIVFVFGMIFSGIPRVNAVKQEKITETFTWTKQVKSIKAGQTYQFKTSEKKAVYKVSNPKYATITKAGLLKAKRVGKIEVLATFGQKKLTCKVQIKGKKIVVIDAGHQKGNYSGVEPIGPGSSTKKAKFASGTQGVSTKMPEYVLTLRISKKLQKELFNRGYQVVMIRTKAICRLSCKQRAVKANKSKGDIFLRIHADGIDNSSAHGASALYPSSKNPYIKRLSKKSKKLSNAILKGMCKTTKATNRGLSPRDDLTGSNWSKIPVSLIEVGFMTNPSEDKKMATSAYQSKIAKGIANGVDNYFKAIKRKKN